MSKKTVKIISTLLIALTLLFSISTLVLAEGTTMSSITVKGLTNDASDPTDTTSTVGKIIGAIMTVAQVIGIGVAVIMLIVLAIKYISAAPSDKAEIKKHAVVYVVGAVVLFAASGILQLVKQFAGIVNSTVSEKGTN